MLATQRARPMWGSGGMVVGFLIAALVGGLERGNQEQFFQAQVEDILSLIQQPGLDQALPALQQHLANDSHHADSNELGIFAHPRQGAHPVGGKTRQACLEATARLPCGDC